MDCYVVFVKIDFAAADKIVSSGLFSVYGYGCFKIDVSQIRVDYGCVGAVRIAVHGAVAGLGHLESHLDFGNAVIEQRSSCAACYISCSVASVYRVFGENCDELAGYFCDCGVIRSFGGNEEIHRSVFLHDYFGELVVVP